jgi:hypothetical protein
VVVAVGFTLVEPVAKLEVKVPGEMAMLVAPAVAQLSVLLEPEVIPVGVATNDEMVGSGPGPGDALREEDNPQPVSDTHNKKAAKIEMQSLAFEKDKSLGRILLPALHRPS